MICLMMDGGKVRRIILLDDSYAKEGFDITGNVKNPTHFTEVAREHAAEILKGRDQ